jgi:hypothetical protein
VTVEDLRAHCSNAVYFEEWLSSRRRTNSLPLSIKVLDVDAMIETLRFCIALFNGMTAEDEVQCGAV